MSPNIKSALKKKNIVSRPSRPAWPLWNVVRQKRLSLHRCSHSAQPRLWEMQDTHFPSLFFLFRTYSHQCQSCMFGAEQYVAKTFVKRCYLDLLLRVGTPRCRLTFWKSGNPRQALERRRLKAWEGKFLNICTGFILWSIARLCTGSEDNGCKFWRYLEFRVCSNGGNTSDLSICSSHLIQHIQQYSIDII